MVTQLSPTIPQYTRVDIPMLREELPKRSGGRISVTLASWPERNLTGPELLRVLRAGQIDLGGIALPTVAGDAPLLDIIDLAGLLSSHAMGRKVAEAVMPELNKELERFNVRIIATYPFPAQVFFCREPITSLADVKGRRVRTPGGSQNDFIQAIGGQPVAIGFPEVYSALERGVVDCAVTGTATGNGARWYEVTKHMYALPVQWGVAAYGVNLAWWNKLDPAVRDFLQKVMNEVQEKQWALGARADRGRHRVQCRQGGGLQDRPRGVRQADDDRARDRCRHAATLKSLAHQRRAARLGQALRRALRRDLQPARRADHRRQIREVTAYRARRPDRRGLLLPPRGRARRHA